MWIQTSVRFSKTFGYLAAFEIGFEIDQSEHDHGHATWFGSRATKQPAQIVRVILSELSALTVQAALWCIQFIRRTLSCPVDIIVPD